MKNLLAFAAFLAVAAPALAQEPKPYTNKEWNFSAVFPYAVKEQPGPEGGQGITVASANAEDTIAYMISVFTISDDVLAKKPQGKILADAVEGANDNVKGKLLRSVDIKLGPYPGKAFDIQSDAFIATCRIYLVGNRMYLPMVIAKPELKLPISAPAVHDAFKVSYKPATK